MLLSGSSTDSLSAGTLVLIACFSAVCLLNGVRHYHGRGTWLLRWLPTEASFFAPAWYGAMGLMVVLCELAGGVSRLLEAVLAIPTLVLFAVALVSLVWLPSRLLPEWYRDRRQRRTAAPATR
jgi:hypothetical protein